MKVLFDEGIPRPLKRALPQHEVQTLAAMNWVGIKNGELLKLIDTVNFDVFLTGDKNMENQQKVLGRSLAILVLSAINWTVIRDHIPAIEAALGRAAVGTCSTVDCGNFLPARFRPPPGDSSAETG